MLKRNMCCRVEGRTGDEGDEGSEEAETLLQNGSTEQRENIDTGQEEATAPTRRVAVVSGLLPNVEISLPADETVLPADTGDLGQNGESAVPSAPISLTLSSDTFPSLDVFEDEEEEPLSVAGKILLELTYSRGASKLSISIVRASDIPLKDRGGSTSVSIHITLLPLKKFRRKTKIKPSTNPVFNESFEFFPIDPAMMEESTLRIRLYGHERLSRAKIIGECEIVIAEYDFESAMADEAIWKTLTPKGLTVSYSLDFLQVLAFLYINF